MSRSAVLCLACGGEDVRSLLSIDRAPVLCNEICSTREDALAAPLAEIRLSFCGGCGHIFNASFDPELIEYGPSYENSLHFSPRFCEYSAELVARLARRHTLLGEMVIEVGCGSGDFLRELCEATGAWGYGYDPSCRVTTEGEGRVRLSADSYFDVRDAPAPALLCNRHVLEHVAQPRGFLAALAGKLGRGSGAALYLEVPNALYTLRDLGIWDIIYEHPSYFTAQSLHRVVASAGFQEIEIEEVFGGQFLSLHARLREGPGEVLERPQAVSTVTALADRFADAYMSKLRRWRTVLGENAHAERKVALWGAGSKGSSFLNVAARDHPVEFVVDVNPRKQDKFIAGTGHPIVDPEALRSADVDTIILMNPLYADEVRAILDRVRPGAELVIA